MASFFVIPDFGFEKTVCFDWCKNETVTELKKRLHSFFSIEDGAYYLTHHGSIVQDTHFVKQDGIYRVCLKALGGKGGFGSMLRAIGAQIEKTTNREACRDLSGRRMRDVNNEKKLKDWIGKKADREREKERIRKERLARRLAVPKHNFDDPNYEDQKSQVSDNLEDALQTGLQKFISRGEGTSANGSKESLGKRSAECSEAGPSNAKVSRKSLEWMGVEGGSDLDSDISDSDSEQDNKPLHSEEPNGNSEKISSASDSNLENIDGKTDLPKVDEPTQIKNTSHSSLLSSLPPPKYSSETTQQSEDAHEKDPAFFDLEKFSSAEELEQLGLDTLKTVLLFRGLKCGGTLQQRAERLFSVKGLKPEEINPSLLAKSQSGKGGKKKKS